MPGKTPPPPATLGTVVEKLDTICEKLDNLTHYYRLSSGHMALLTIQQAAELLAVERGTIERLIRKGHLACINLSVSPASKKPRRRVCQTDLVLFMEKRRIEIPTLEYDATRRQRRRAIRAEVGGK